VRPVETPRLLTNVMKQVGFVIAASLGALSSIASFVIIYAYSKNTSQRSDWDKLLVWLSLCDLGQGIYFLLVLTTKWNLDWCVILGFWGIFTEAASCFWTAAVAHYLFKRIRSMKELVEKKAASKFYHLLAWGYPTLVMLATIVIQSSQGQSLLVRCEDEDCLGCFYQIEQWPYRFVSIYLPQWSSWLTTLFLYIITYRTLKSFDKSPEVSNLRKKLMLIPLCFILLRIAETVLRVREYVYYFSLDKAMPTDTFTNVLYYLQCVCNPSQGIFNFVLFVLLSKKKSRAVCLLFGNNMLSRLCECCMPEEEEEVLLRENETERVLNRNYLSVVKEGSENDTMRDTWTSTSELAESESGFSTITRD